VAKPPSITAHPPAFDTSSSTAPIVSRRFTQDAEQPTTETELLRRRDAID
jgi:hypothetical protein